MPPAAPSSFLRPLAAALLVLGAHASLGAQKGPLRYMVLQSSTAPAGQYPFLPDDLGPLTRGATPEARRMRGYADEALAQFKHRFGHAPANDLQVAMAMTDWVATVMKHPAFWPADPSLPRYNPLHDPELNDLAPDPLKMLEYVLRFDPADATLWPSPQCGHQNRVVIGLLNSQGIYGRMVALQMHTGLEFYSFRLHKWVYIDATHNEHYVLNGRTGKEAIPLNVAELHALTLAKRLKDVSVVKHGYPGSNIVYLSLYPMGFLRYAVHTYMKQYGPAGKESNSQQTFVMVSEDMPRPGTQDRWSPQDPTRERTEPYWFTLNGVRDSSLVSPVLDALGLADEITLDSLGVAIKLTSCLPYTATFQRRPEKGTAWLPVHEVANPGPGPVDSPVFHIGPGEGTVRFRAVGSAGNATQEFVIHVD